MDEAEWMARVRVPAKVVILFTRQLGVMLRSGIPLVGALDSLSQQDDCPNFGEVVHALSRQVAVGHAFSEALRKFPRVFPTIYRTMVRIGESMGNLERALERLADWQERDYAIFHKVRGALTYPAFICGLSGVLTLVLFTQVLPGFIDIFEEMEVRLPLATRVMIVVTHLVGDPIAWLLGLGGLVVGAGFLRDRLRTPRGALRAFRLAIRVPLAGPLIHFTTLARFSAAASLLLAEGIGVAQAMKLAARASGSPELAQDEEAMAATLTSGEQISVHMRQRPAAYPRILMQMASAGEETSRLPDMLERAALYYDLEVNHKVETLGAVLEPLLLAAVAAVVSFVVISIFLPLYSYLGKLG